MEIKRVIITPSYCCYGDLTMMRHIVYTVTKDKIKFSIKPLDKASIYNPKIEFEYDANGFDDEWISYTHSVVWLGIVDILDELEKEPKIHILDCIETSVVVEYCNGKKRKIENISEDGSLALILREISNLMPTALKEILKANEA